ncbi:Uncharacterized protein DAT39_005053, partial [Clarias magur]
MAPQQHVYGQRTFPLPRPVTYAGGFLVASAESKAECHWIEIRFGHYASGSSGDDCFDGGACERGQTVQDQAGILPPLCNRTANAKFIIIKWQEQVERLNLISESEED